MTNPDSGSGERVREARADLDGSISRDVRYEDFYIKRVDALIAAARAEGRQEAATEFLEKMSLDPESAVAAQMGYQQGRAEAIRECREKVTHGLYRARHEQAVNRHFTHSMKEIDIAMSSACGAQVNAYEEMLAALDAMEGP